MAMFVEHKNTIYKSTMYRSEISQAWCPAHVECCVSVGKSAQLRRALLLKIQSMRRVFSLKHLYMSNFSQSFGRLAWREQVSWGASRKSAPLELPVTPRVRVLETIDLSASGIEHFLRDDTLVPMTPKLTAFAPLQEIKALPPDSITA